jgi:hypothetical protein
VVTSSRQSLKVYAKAALETNLESVLEGHCTRAESLLPIISWTAYPEKDM